METGKTGENLDNVKELETNGEVSGEKEKNQLLSNTSSHPDASTLASLKQKNKYLRKTYTVTANLLKSQMAH